MDAFAQGTRLSLPGSRIRLSALEWSPDAAADPPILLHHGLASSAGFWGPTAVLLSGTLRGRRHVVALDARGHGESDRPDDGYDFGTVGDDLHASLDALGWTAGGRRPLLVGHSWGGNVILEYAARHPDVPAGIALVDGGFIELQHSLTWEETERELAPPRLEPMTWDEFAERAASRRPGGWDPPVEAAVRHNFEDLPDGTIRVRLSRDRHMQILRALWEQRPSELYAAVRCPVLIIPARRDAPGEQEHRFIEGKTQAVALAERVLRLHGVPVAVTWFEDSIHDVPLQRPAELAARLGEFAASLEP